MGNSYKVRQDTIDGIVEWHKKTFPDVDLKSQKLKFLEEYKEYLESGDIMELADMAIVNYVLYRRYDCSCFSDIISEEWDDELISLVKKKMAVNKKRKWNKVNGVYRHED